MAMVTDNGKAVSGRWRPFIVYSVIVALLCALFAVGFFFDIHLPCLFKRLTGIPCPGCGMQRSVLSLMHGDLYGAFMTYNPVGALLVIIVATTYVWQFIDCLWGTDSLRRATHSTNGFNWKTAFLIAATIALTAANWWWNISKGL